VRPLDLLEHARRLRFMVILGYHRDELEVTPVGLLPAHRDGRDAIRRWEEIYGGPEGHVARVQASLEPLDEPAGPADSRW
jgi:hypothetical protein